jgi:hypothetical protein
VVDPAVVSVLVLILKKKYRLVASFHMLRRFLWSSQSAEGKNPTKLTQFASRHSIPAP